MWLRRNHPSSMLAPLAQVKKRLDALLHGEKLPGREERANRKWADAQLIHALRL